MNERFDGTIRWEFHHFASLSSASLYAALQLRQIVFIVEQNCVFLDADGRDDTAWHLLGRSDVPDDDAVIAYSRIFAPGDMYEEASIGRVITHPQARGRGLGRAVMRESMTRVRGLFGDVPIRISAQLHLEAFYTSLGFIKVGEPYIDDGIPHIGMTRRPDIDDDSQRTTLAGQRSTP